MLQGHKYFKYQKVCKVKMSGIRKIFSELSEGEESHHRQKDRIGNDGGMRENVTCFECLAHGKPGHKPKRGEIIKIIRTRVIS